MKNFIVLFREPDGRTEKHADEDIQLHQLNWKNWLGKWGKAGNLSGGSSLTLHGKMIKGTNGIVSNEIHTVGKEIIGGFLLLKANDLEEATEIAKTCPVYEFEGYAEVREMQN